MGRAGASTAVGRLAQKPEKEHSSAVACPSRSRLAGVGTVEVEAVLEERRIIWLVHKEMALRSCGHFQETKGKRGATDMTDD